MSLGVGASCEEFAHTGSIVGPQFCAPEPIHLAFTMKAPWPKDNHITVTDIHGKFILWSAASPTWSFRSRQILYNTSNSPLISMQEKIRSVHKRWQVFSDAGNLLFSVKKSSIVQVKSKFDVFLASNKGEEVCDFKIKGSYRERTCTVYKGDSQIALAQMSKKHKVMNLPQGKHIFGVDINPNTDYCFITTLFVILHEIYDNEVTKVGGAIRTTLGEIATATFYEFVDGIVGEAVGKDIGEDVDEDVGEAIDEDVDEDVGEAVNEDVNKVGEGSSVS